MPFDQIVPDKQVEGHKLDPRVLQYIVTPARRVSSPVPAAADHPVVASVPESEYLKAVWMRLG